MTIALTTGLFVFLAALDADATPIRPDIRKLVTENQATSPKPGPARAGWNGPELPVRDTSANPALDPAVTLRSNKAALMTAAVPDSRAVMAVFVVIVLLRILRSIQEKEQRAAQATVVRLEPKQRIAA